MGRGRDSSEGEVDGRDPGEFDEPDLTCPWSVCQVGKLAAERDDLRRRIGEQAGTHLEKFIQWRRRVRDAETRLASALGALKECMDLYNCDDHEDADKVERMAIIIERALASQPDPTLPPGVVPGPTGAVSSSPVPTAGEADVRKSIPLCDRCGHKASSHFSLGLERGECTEFSCCCERFESPPGMGEVR
jgi:hypothetical protein